MRSSVTLGAPALVVVPGLLGAAGLDHHDGDVVAYHAAGHDDLERAVVTVFVGDVGNHVAVLA